MRMLWRKNQTLRLNMQEGFTYIANENFGIKNEKINRELVEIER